VRCGPAVEEACGVDLTKLRGIYVADLGLPSSIVTDATGAIDHVASALARDASRRQLSAWNTLLEHMSSHATVVNPPHTHDLHGLKPWEMEVSRQNDWQVPLTLATSDPSALLALDRGNSGSWIQKGMVGGYGYTVAFRPPETEEDARARVAERPVMVQERIEGDNVRAFVVGSAVVGAARIIPEDGGEIDSRRGSGRLERIQLDEGTCSLALRAADHWGLAFCAVDLMHDEVGDRYVLLECNSAPFFVEFERRTGIDVSSALADLLLGRR
jgi:glutathione synthase/RimK-type ligase-like ATP-grasp enzyme